MMMLTSYAFHFARSKHFRLYQYGNESGISLYRSIKHSLTTVLSTSVTHKVHGLSGEQLNAS